MNTNEFPKAKVVRFKDEVSYQQGSIVSKTITKNNSGNVSLFAFSKGEALSEHTAAFDAMIQVLDGKAQVLINGQPFDLTEGDTIIMPANIPHAVMATEDFKMLLTMIKEVTQ
jgi:quercetin dioxygenase-like cupin family protein